MTHDPSLDETQSHQRTKPMQAIKPEQEENTPAPAPIPAPRKQKKQKPRRAVPFGYLFLWLLTLVSILTNVIIIRQLLLTRSTAAQLSLNAAQVVDDMQGQTYSYIVVVDETLIIETDIPINTTIPVVVDQVLPINTTVIVPVDGGIFGEIVLNVPIKTDIPVYFEQDITIDQVFPVHTPVPVHFEVPIVLTLSELPINDTLENVQIQLEALAEELNKPILPAPAIRE